MNGEDRRGGAPQDPPWSPELLADLHAGSLDREVADEVRARALADPEAREILSALDATSADLSAQPSPAMPDDVAGRIEASLRDEARSRDVDAAADTATAGAPVSTSSAPAPQPFTSRPSVTPQDRSTGESPVVDLDAARQQTDRRQAETRRPRTFGRRETGPRRSAARRAGWAAGLVAAAAAVVGVVVVATPVTNGGGGRPQAAAPGTPSRSAPDPAGPPLALRGSGLSLSGEQLSAVLGTEQYSGLSNPEQLIGCLQANGVDGGNPLGAREINLDGEPAQLLVLPTGRIGEFRLLVVGPDCGPGNPATIAETTVGG